MQGPRLPTLSCAMENHIKPMRTPQRRSLSSPTSISLTCGLWLVACIVSGASMTASAAESGITRPNIVLILADDLGYETLNCYGGQSYATPHLDRLAANGLRFDRAYAMPLCTNTRIQLMTGFYNQRNWKAFGILDPQATTLGHLLQQAGYRTCIAGKWQLTSYDPVDYPGAELRRDTGMRIADAGFDEYSLWHTGHTEDKGSRYANPVIEQNGSLRTDTAGRYGPDLWTDFIGDFMSRNREHPFFVYYSMALPHNPMNPTPDSPEWNRPDMRLRDETRFAKDMIEYTDKMVGKVVARLEELGLSERTLILFYSDNGTNYRVRSQFRGLTVGGEKGKASELGVRVPLIAYWPTVITGGAQSNALVDSVDFLPTLLDVADHNHLNPPEIDGVSFRSILEGKADSVRDYVYIHQDPRPGWDKDRFHLERVAIGERYKLYEDGRLFDLTNDFFERNPIWPQQDSPAARNSRLFLEQTLASYEPYPTFIPSQVPRPSTAELYKKHAFQPQRNGNLFVVEAEQLPLDQQSPWRVENHAPGYTGLGYLTTLAASPDSLRAAEGDEGESDTSDFPSLGMTSIRLINEAEGDFRVALRVRNDHALAKQQPPPSLWFRSDSAMTRQVLEYPSDENPSDQFLGQWQWIQAGSVRLNERLNVFSLVPGAASLKLDRIVIYRQEVEEEALSLTMPASAFHPWASP
ncbi:MAG: sulfatase-like hydrolase/transferase [bacterium]|nr:sulfatase-like hydrolase/transferase [bacterium]